MRQLLDQLTNSLRELAPGGLCIAFSGGVDSALLLKVACTVSDHVHAVTMYTPFHSPVEREEAARMAEQFGATHSVIALDAMPDEVMGNPPDRCYLCKRTVFTTIRKYADSHGLAHVLDGTNADDLYEYRPGLRALTELEVRSPLAELGLHKPAVRDLAAELGLTVADKPSAPCLATRFPYNNAITPEMLRGIDAIEDAVKALGVRVVRARAHADTIRLEVLPESFAAVVEGRAALLETIREAGYERLTLDLAGYHSGSFDKPYR